jgi:mRNA-degrading endonuclease RelE of RelBE toxin-antitoxin system
MSEQPLIEVEASPTFNRNLRTLAKKYRNIRSDIQPIANKLKQGELPGEEIPGIGFEVFKVRVRNSDVQKGKSGGYRLIYYVKTETSIILLTIYTKSEQADVPADSIRGIIAEYEQRAVENEEEV